MVNKFCVIVPLLLYSPLSIVSCASGNCQPIKCCGACSSPKFLSCTEFEITDLRLIGAIHHQLIEQLVRQDQLF